MALFHVRLGRRTIAILPLLSLKCLVRCIEGLALCLGAAALALETIVLPALESGRMIETEGWVRENDLINRNNSKKILPDPERVWRSVGHPVCKRGERSRRILVLGDSFVWGDGVLNMNDLWWRRLERELRRRGYDDVEVIAAGDCGYGTATELTLARRLLPAYRPDIVIWGYVTNDPDGGMVSMEGHVRDPEAPQLPARDFAFRGLCWMQRHQVLPRLMDQLSLRRQRKVSNVDPAPAYFDWELRLLDSDNLERYRATIARVAELQASAGVPCFFLTLPSFPDRDHFERRYAPVAPIFARCGVRFHDVLGPFVARYGGTREKHQWGVNPANAHPGLTATQFFAEQAADVLERDYPQALPPRVTPRPPALVVNDWCPWTIAPRQEGDSVTLRWPADARLLLKMPHGDPHVFLAFEEAVPLRTIRVHGPGLRSSRVAVAYDDPEGLREDRLDPRDGTQASWSLPQTPLAVNAVRLSAELSPSDRALTIEFERR